MSCKKYASFTLIELLLSIGIAMIVLSSASGLYLMGVNAYRKAQINRELAQNGRILVDRITREIRKTTEIATDLPVDDEEELSSEIIFRNGDDLNEINYVKYFLDEDKVRRQAGFYCFASDVGKNHVTWNSIGLSGESPVWEIQSNNIVAENFSHLGFFGNPLVKMRFLLSKSGATLNIASAALGRNIN